jgi:hypothetical protein
MNNPSYILECLRRLLNDQMLEALQENKMSPTVAKAIKLLLKEISK